MSFIGSVTAVVQVVGRKLPGRGAALEAFGRGDDGDDLRLGALRRERARHRMVCP